MSYLPIEDLARNAFDNTEEFDNLSQTGMDVFYAAMVLLQSAGMHQVHVQLLLGKPFSQFTQDHCFVVKVMALALRRNRVTVAQWHELIRNAAFWAQMHNQSFGFATETLPDIDHINSVLGLSSMGQLPAASAEPPAGWLPAPKQVEEDLSWLM